VIVLVGFLKKRAGGPSLLEQSKKGNESEEDGHSDNHPISTVDR